MPDVMGRTPSKMFNLCLISLQDIFPKALGIIRMFVFFLFSSGFAMELSYGTLLPCYAFFSLNK